MDSNVVRGVPREHLVPAWVGDRERLDRITRVLYGAAERGKPPVGHDEIRVSAKATLRNGEWIEGEPGGVFAEMDRRALSELVLVAGPDFRNGSIGVTFDRVKGVTVESKGDRDWVDASHTALVEEAERGRPFWWWLRSLPALMALGLLFAGLCGDLLYGVYAGEDPARRLFGAVFVGSFVGLSLASALIAILKRVLPGFEVVEPGERGKGARALGVAGALASLVASLSISLLT